MFHFDAEVVSINDDTWNSTNVINTNCILTNLRNLNKNLEEEPKGEKPILAEFAINILEEDNICIVVDKELKISRFFVETAMNSHGHWDIYFGPFLLEKFEITLFYRYLSLEESDSQMYTNYSNIFLQLCNEQVSLSRTFTENWYENQLEKLVNDEFSISEI